MPRNGTKNLIPAKKGEIRNPNGRPKKLGAVLVDLLPEEVRGRRFAKNELAELYESLLHCGYPELQALMPQKPISGQTVKPCTTPAIVLLMAQSILSDIKKGEIKNFAQWQELHYGRKAQVQMELTGKDGAPLQVAMQPLFPDAASDILLNDSNDSD